MSSLELDKMTPVKPPIVKRKINPSTQKRTGCSIKIDPKKVASQLNTFTPVGTAITIVAAVK